MCMKYSQCIDNIERQKYIRILNLDDMKARVWSCRHAWKQTLHYRAINNKPPLVVEIIRDMRILRRKFENNKSRKNFETKI